MALLRATHTLPPSPLVIVWTSEFRYARVSRVTLSTTLSEEFNVWKCIWDSRTSLFVREHFNLLKKKKNDCVGKRASTRVLNMCLAQSHTSKTHIFPLPSREACTSLCYRRTFLVSLSDRTLHFLGEIRNSNVRYKLGCLFFLSNRSIFPRKATFPFHREEVSSPFHVRKSRGEENKKKKRFYYYMKNTSVEVDIDDTCCSCLSWYFFLN